MQRIRVWSSKAERVDDVDTALANQFFLGPEGELPRAGCQLPHPAGGVILIPFSDSLAGVPAPIRRRVELLAY